ncbi:MAG: PDZ domain-containing protein [Burkholderiaceae bacterium]|nr:PDZ domain-containing protein [Burkholderiaceae bacterium]
MRCTQAPLKSLVSGVTAIQEAAATCCPWLLLAALLFCSASARSLGSDRLPGDAGGCGFAAAEPPLGDRASRVADGAAVHAWLGVMSQDLTQSMAESLGLAHPDGALVAAVMAGSPAHAAGLKPGDVITAVDGEPVLGSQDLSRVIALAAPGDTLRLTIWRHRASRVVAVCIGRGERGFEVHHGALADPLAQRPRLEAAAAQQIDAPPIRRIDRAQVRVTCPAPA